MMKSLLAAAAVAGTMTLALPASEAKADVDVDIGIGVGGFYPGHYDGYYGGGYYGGGYYGGGYYGGDYGRYRDRISCKTGRKIVDRSGFNRVKAIDCSLPGYKYSAWKRGHKFVVNVNGRGDITRIRRVY